MQTPEWGCAVSDIEQRYTIRRAGVWPFRRWEFYFDGRPVFWMNDEKVARFVCRQLNAAFYLGRHD
jgi:hypothetical protein